MKGGFGVILGSILTQRRCDRAWFVGRGGGGGANLRLSDHESNVLHGGFCFCVCMEIVFALSHAGNKYFLSRQILSVHSPSGFNGRPLNNTFDIIALVVE